MSDEQGNELRTEPRWRFDIVVWNFKRPMSFTENTWRISNLTPGDRLSFVTASPSREEESIVRDWASRNGVTHRYIPRPDRGIDSLARCEYFIGECGGSGNMTDSHFIFQMQDHYLDTTSPWSRWDARFNFRVKGDVVPDDVFFDLNALQNRMDKEGCVAAFADRNNPCWFERNSVPHIAPSGGNFILRTNALTRPGIQQKIRHIQHLCDNSYRWAVYVEFALGTLFFHEGTPVYDIKRDLVFRQFLRENFYVAPDEVAGLFRYFESSRIARMLDVRHPFVHLGQRLRHFARQRFRQSLFR